MDQSESSTQIQRSKKGNSLSLQHNKCKGEPTYNYWTQKENQIYASCLKKYVKEAQEAPNCKKVRIFKKISNILGTRTSIQVKAHHQKMKAKFITVEAIISHFTVSPQEQPLELIELPTCELSKDLLIDQPSFDFFHIGNIEFEQPSLFLQEYQDYPQGITFTEDPWSSIDFILKSN